MMESCLSEFLNQIAIKGDQMTETRSLWFQALGKPVILNESLPSLKKGWCEIQTLYSAVSPGTERLVLMGKIPSSLLQAMKCPYMGGGFSFPVKYGYSLVGVIQRGPKKLTGERVHVMHPHQDRCVVRTKDAYPLPPDIPSQRAVLASNLETAVTAVWDSKLRLGERVLVVGFGIIGSLIAQLIKNNFGTEVKVTDTSTAKQKLAEKMGFVTVLPKKSEPLFDLSFHTSGTSEGLQTAVNSVSLEGRVIEVSWYGTQKVRLSLGGSFHSGRKKIISSQVSRIPAELQSRWDFNRRKKLVFKLLKDPVFDSHLTHQIPFSELPRLFQKIKSLPSEGLGYLIKYR
jgi:threonine dehydrogenase-like Zn-dependent dehydrogenase